MSKYTIPFWWKVLSTGLTLGFFFIGYALGSWEGAMMTCGVSTIISTMSLAVEFYNQENEEN